ncbi:MAG: caspase family protein [Candidatus Shapirobacteria bacterium]|jgi:hypothetical protein
MRKALIVGINDYKDCPLLGCVNDASSLSSILSSNGDGSPNFDVMLKTDIKNKSELKTHIKELFEGNVETALFYFSGHGFLNNLGGYIVTPDYQPNDEGVSMNEILTFANQSKAQNKIIILDCCHSGSFGSPPEQSVSISQITEGLTILTASKENESAVEENGHGIFTNLLLGALRGEASDLMGNITPGSVYSYIDQALGPWDQRPIFKTNITKFTPIRNISPLIPLDILRKITLYFPTPQEEFKLDPSFEDSDKNADLNNVEIFKNLQKFERNGLVIPVGEDYMYYAAMKSKSCKLTALGWRYWALVDKNRI